MTSIAGRSLLVRFVLVALALVVVVGVAASTRTDGRAIFSAVVVDDTAGENPVLVLDAVGNPVIAYVNPSVPLRELRLARCASPDCATATIEVVATGTMWLHGLALDSGGNPVLAYVDEATHQLIIARCVDAGCSEPPLVATPAGGEHAAGVATLAIDGNDRPLIAFGVWEPQTGDRIGYLHCGTPDCSSASAVDFGSGHWGLSMGIGPSGNPTITYSHGNVGVGRVVIACHDLDCSSYGPPVTLDPTSYAGFGVSLVFNSAGHPRIAYVDQTSGELRLAACEDATCSAGATVTPVFRQSYPVAGSVSLALDQNDRPVMAIGDIAAGRALLIRCGDETCSANNVASDIDIGSQSGYSLALGSGDLPVLAHTYWYLSGGSSLRVVRCDSPTCGGAPLAPPPVRQSSLTCTPSSGDLSLLSNIWCTFTPRTSSTLPVWEVSPGLTGWFNPLNASLTAVSPGTQTVRVTWVDYGGPGEATVSYVVAEEVGAPYVDAVSPLMVDVTNVQGNVFGHGFAQGASVELRSGDATYLTPALGVLQTQLHFDFSGQLVQAGTYELSVLNPEGLRSNPVEFIVVPAGQPPAELRFVDPQGNFLSGPLLDFASTGSRVRACVVDGETLSPVALPVGITLADMVFTGGGGHLSIGDPDPGWSDVFVEVGTTGASAGATCISWRSLNAGSQSFSLVYTPEGGSPTQVLWDTDGDSNGGVGPAYSPLRIGWAQLENAVIGYNGSVYVGNDTLNPVGGAVLSAGSPATGFWVGGYGSYVDEAGQVHASQVAAQALTGLTLAVSPSDGCALVWPDITAISDRTLPYTLDPSGCPAGSEVDVTLSATVPNPIGSGGAPSATAILRVTIASPVPPAKRVFLAWAGQRVILEHDWRTPPGDAADVEPNGSCLFAGPTPIRYVKGSGRGNFLPGVGVDFWSTDEVLVTVSASSQQLPSQVPSDPQGACISRALFESEDPGQVDIEAFPDTGDHQVPKVSFVVYYMKLESVTLSLETGLAKPSTNGLNGDFAPGNPWQASAAPGGPVSRNVSTDLLVRGRVKGWFVNDYPSGRPFDDSNPQNVLPADRWVMPDDWALLAGGPADPADGSDVSGTAEQFRPYYDIMSAPNSGLVCLGLEGLCMERAIGEDAVSEVTGPFVGPYSVLDIPGISSAALGNTLPLSIRETILRDGDIDMWDAPMPPALVNVDIRGAGYLRQVRKQDVYYLGIPDMQGPGQSFPNLFYRSNIPDSPFIPAVVAGGGYLWDSWGNDGPGGSGQGAHEFWTPVLVGVNTQGAGDPTLTADDLLELEGIAAAADDSTIARTLVVYSDNHGEFMVAANGRFKAAAGSCQPNPVAGTSTITAVADYPDFRGKHFTVASNVATVNWTPDAVSIGSLSPSTVVAGSENVQLSLTGSGFVTGVSQLCVNGVPASTTVISATSLEAILQGPTQAATYQIRVANPVAGGGVSNTLLLLGTVQPTSVTEIAVVTNDDPEETATVSTPPPAPQASPVVTVQTSPGTGTVAVAIYETNPGETPSFAIGTGGAPGTYVDAYVSPSSTFASATIVICDPNGGDVAYWWDGWAWSPADDQSFDADTGCITVTVTTATSPKITDLSGTVFAAALGYAPMIESVSVSPGLVTVGTPVTASVVFSDLDLPGDLHVATWDWGDGSTSQANANAAATHQYQGPGVYTVVVTVTDADGATASSTFRYVVVFDAAGGFVTGGGWIASPAGAYAADPALTGKATFGFVSQYKKGQQVPSGNTEFQFSAGRLNFKSTSYEWLVVAGSKAQFRGRGTIEGRGDYAFFVTAIDGDSDGGKKPDKFRIRIWDRLNGGLVYDNQLSAPDDAQPTTVLGGGSIVVHR